MTGLVVFIIIGLVLLGVRYVLSHPDKVFTWVLRRKLRKAARRAEKAARASQRNARGSQAQGQRRAQSDDDDERIIPPEYAEDVEFVEVKEFSQTTIAADDRAGTASAEESQISDAEWVEIKKN